MVWRLILLGFAVWQFWRLVTASTRERRRLNAESVAIQDPAILSMAEGLARRAGAQGGGGSGRGFGRGSGEGGALRRLPGDPSLNAMVTPNGDIYLTDGLVSAHARGDVTEDELAFVLAHELGHYKLGHARQRFALWIAQASGGRVLARLVGPVLARFLGPLALLITLLQPLLARFLGAQLSQGHEYEADAFAADLLARDGRSAEAGPALLSKLDAGGGVLSAGGPSAWLASHPRVEDRVRALRRRGPGARSSETRTGETRSG